ncbi:hypothetical protein BDV33DRAFT_204559 [Aspergillus novoparasiticus]|uniref:Rhodopsin domain-containing protein n=1 Tax=Aspergillus novoparasiticus TaxID=986946 RepID=A0A5N6ER57_9EURO|nr:hypothetical protein BDV33DRAFT_204559 [Aspergillus novoparasiticus]
MATGFHNQGLVKCSIVVVLRRIFGVSSPAFRIATWINLAFCASWNLMTILNELLNCRPLNYHWFFKSPAGQCVNPNATYTAVGMVDMITDVLIILTPVPMILRLRIAPLQKLGILGVFAFGAVAIAITVFRTITMLTVDFATIFQTGKMVFIWTTIEWAVAIIVASAPMPRPLIEHIIHHKIFQSFTKVLLWVQPNGFYTLSETIRRRSRFNPIVTFRVRKLWI